jgi:hypothetical protein
MTKLQTRRTIRIKVPASWTKKTDTGAVRSRPESVDVIIGASEDVRDTLISLTQQFFTLDEEKIPVVVPFISPKELRARIVQWETWKKRRDEMGLPYPEETDTLIATLKTYVDQIEQYRALRASLSETVSGILGQHADDSMMLVDWMRQNAENFRAAREQDVERLTLIPKIRAVQAELNRFSDDVNMPWCRNDLLTTPVYSLLDPWFPGRPGLHPPMSCDSAPGTLPILCMATENDIVFDLTQFSSRTVPLKIPVLHPVQVFLTIPSPPGFTGPAPKGEKLKLANLPPIPELSAVLQNQTEVTVRTAPPAVTVPATPLNLPRITTNLDRALAILSNRNQTYDRFWNSLTSSTTCTAWGTSPCVHNEMDLRERIGKAVAMPGVALPEQLLIRENERVTMPLNDEEYPAATGWQVAPPTGARTRDFTDLHVQFREQALDGDRAPYALPLKHLFQIFDRIPEVPLTTR